MVRKFILIFTVFLISFCASAKEFTHSYWETTINAIIEFDPESIYYEDLNNRILIEKLKDDDITNKLINNMIELLEELEKSYKDNIKIIRR